MKLLRQTLLNLALLQQTLRSAFRWIVGVFCVSFLTHFCVLLHTRFPQHFEVLGTLALCCAYSFAPSWLPLPIVSWMGLSLAPHHALHHPAVAYAAKHIATLYTQQSLQSLMFSTYLTGALCIGALCWKKVQHWQTAPLMSVKRFRWMLRIKRKASSITLHTLPLVKGTESQHLLFVGTTGSGKSNALYHILDSLRANKHRAIIVDSTGLIAQHYKSPGDIYFNPSEPDTDAWQLFEDYNNDEDFAHFAATMIPPPDHQQEPFWSHASQTVLRTLLSLSTTGGITQLQRLLFHTPLPTLIDILSTTPAQTLLTKEADKTSGSILAHLNSAAQSLRFVKNPEDIAQDRKAKNAYLQRQVFSPHVRSFSLQSWIVDKDKPWMFLTTFPQNRAALLPLLSVLIDTSLRTIMRQQPDTKQNIWVILDELPSLQRLPSLATLTTEGRKYGTKVLACIQSIAQLEERYTKTSARVLLDMFGTKVIFRCPNVDTATWLSRTLGTRKTPSTSEQLGIQNKGPYWSYTTENNPQPVVSAQDIMDLKDLNAFVQFPGSWPLVRTTLPYKILKNS